MSTTVTYKGATLTTVDNATVTLETAGKYCEDDFTLTDVSGGGGASIYPINGILAGPTSSVFIGNTTNPTSAIVGCAEEGDIVNVYVVSSDWVVSATRDDTQASVAITKPTTFIYRFTMPASSVSLNYIYDD